MLTVFSHNVSTNCEGVSRRDFLRIGSLALGSLSLSELLAAQAGASTSNYVRDKSVVLLYLSGGASHIETFDPKMTAPDGVRSVTGELKTSLPGVTFGGTFPQLAARADRLAVVRSFQHPVGSHEQAHVHVLTGGTDRAGQGNEGFSMGSLYTRLGGTNHPRTGMPSYSLLVEEEIDGQYRKELGRIRKGSRPGELGVPYAPLEYQTGWRAGDDETGDRNRRDKKDESALVANMRLNLPIERFEDRRALLRDLDRLSRQADSAGAMTGFDRFNQQAADLIVRGASQAFQIDDENPRLVERYDTSHIRIGHKVFRPSTLGKQMLTARRLCEAGCGFVTVHSAGWDMHADGNNPGMIKGMEMLGRSLDKAVSAFLDDVADRGLSDKILLVVTGDFGRTPKVNKKGGRDHWARLGTLAFAGGGLEMGQVIGQSARGADVPAADPISTPNLMATIMHTLFDIGQLRLQSGLPRDLLKQVEDSPPIERLF